MDKYVLLAKKAVEIYIKSGEIMKAPAGLPEEFYSRQSGVFVTIHKGEELRGCIGTIVAVKKNLAEEIIENAVAACSRDNRFALIEAEELPALSYEVSILSEPEFIGDLGKHDPKEHGLIVRCADGRAGLLLPDLEGIDSTEKQLAIACRKGGIDFSADSPQLYFFTAEKHSEESILD